MNKIDISIPMIHRTSAGTVTYRENDSKIEILLNRRHFKFNDTYDLSLPKGKIDEGESVQKAAIRETLEETGYEVEITDFIDQINFNVLIKQENKYHSGVTFFFLAKLAKNKQVDLKDAPEVTEVLWLDIDKAINNVSYDDHKNILKNAKDLLHSRKVTTT